MEQGRRKTINIDEYQTVKATTHGVLNELELKYLTKIACKLGGMYMDSKWLEGPKIISNKVKAPITISFPNWYIGSLKSIPINKS